jgi:hypothetical protein
VGLEEVIGEGEDIESENEGETVPGPVGGLNGETGKEVLIGGD